MIAGMTALLVRACHEHPAGAEGKKTAAQPGRSARAARRTCLIVLVLAAGMLARVPGAGAAVAPLVTAGQLNAVTALSPADAWAVGLTQSSTVLIEHWDGQQWAPMRAPDPGYVNRLAAVSASSADDVWAVGTQFYSGSTEYYNTLVEHYDGTSWSVVPSPNFGVSSYLTGVKAIAANNVWAVGWVEQSGGQGDRTLVEHWNGTTWSRVPSPSPTGGGASGNGSYSVDTLNAAWASGPNDVWTVGSYYPASNNYFESPLILHWNGSSWKQVPSPSNPSGAVESYLQSVSGTSSGSINAVGADYTSHWMGLVEHWNGSAWRVVPSPDPAASNDTQLLATSAVTAQSAWAVGGEVTERMTQKGWQLAVNANANTSGAGLYGVSADGTSDAWAVGQATYGELEYVVIDHWNGTSWTELTALP